VAGVNRQKIMTETRRWAGENDPSQPSRIRPESYATIFARTSRLSMINKSILPDG